MRRFSFLILFILALVVGVPAQGPGGSGPGPQPQSVIQVTTNPVGTACVAGKIYYNSITGVNLERIGGVCTPVTSGGTPGNVIGPGSATVNDIPLLDATGKSLSDSGKAFSTDGTFASNSDLKVPTEKAVKTYADTKAPLASPAFTGTPIAPTPATTDNSTKLATTAYVTTGISNAIAAVNPAVAVQAATAAILPNSPTYNNGVAGIGAFITTLTLNTPLVVDGYTPALNDRILVKNESGGLGAAKNGVYTVTQVSGVGLAWILTRALDYDQPSDMNNTGAIPVVNGTVNASTSWVQTSQVTTVGTDAVTFTQFSINPTTQVTSSGGTINQLAWFAATGQAISGLATANNGVLITSGGGVPSISSTLPSGITLVAPILGTPASVTLTNATGLPLAGLATQATNTVVGNATAGSASPTALAVGSCSTSGSALIWTTNTGFGCNTSVAANTASTLATPRTIAGVSFNGSANISIASTNLSDTANIAMLNVNNQIFEVDTNGIYSFRIFNTTNGTANRSELLMRAGGSIDGYLESFGSSFTTSGSAIASSFRLFANSGDLVFDNGASNQHRFFVNGTEKWDISTGGHWAPFANNAVDIGTSSLGVRNVYVAGAITGTTRVGLYNFNQAAQSQVVVSATEYYVTRSDLDMPATYTTAIAAGTTMHWRIALTKTAAGTGTFQILLKKGTNGSTADTSIVTQTIGTQTAVADNMECDVSLTWTSTTAAYWTIVPRQSAATGTGFGLVFPAAAAQFSGTISGQTTTTASDKYGLSVIFTTGTPTFVVNMVRAQAFGVD